MQTSRPHTTRPRVRPRTLRLLAAAVGGALLVAAARRIPVAADRCADFTDQRTALDPHCAQLLATPDLPAVTGTLELRPIASPFGVTVTRDGRERSRLVATVAGLPAPATLGPYTRYIAWATTIGMDTTIRLAEVRNGPNELGELAMEQFRILVSAEGGDSVTGRTGRLVLRGTSPGVRLLAHRDLVQPAAPGALRDGGDSSQAAARATPRAGDHAAHDAAHAASAPNAPWPMPPAPAWMRPMPPSMHAMPDVAPFAPGAGVDPATIPPVRPRELVMLRSGDTLRLEASLVRRNIGGREQVMYGYNGQHPGPLLQVQQGATVLVDFRNQLDLPSAVHWHGVRLENRSDGAVGVTQDPVAPGERFLYRVHFRDAGIYWYHPHVREDIQQDLGLAGNILVAPTARDYYASVHREEVLLLDDILLGDDGAPFPHGREAPTHALSGRHGNATLVNGARRWSLNVRRGEVVRFHLTNAANARFFNVAFGDLPLKVVASDVGRFERESWAESAVLAPAERYVVEVRFDRPGDVPLVSRIQALDHMAGWFTPQVDTLGIVHVADVPAAPDLQASHRHLRANRDVAAEFAPLRPAAARPPQHSLTLAVRTGNVPNALATMLWGVPVGVDWNDGMPMANWAATGRRVTWLLRDDSTGRENMDVRWRFALGDLVRLRLYNDPFAPHAMAHPIHVHGQRFVVLSRNAVPNDNLVWKDTAVIPVGETVEILVEMSNPGRWMLHCHIAEHLGAGMMMVFDVQ